MTPQDKAKAAVCPKCRGSGERRCRCAGDECWCGVEVRNCHTCDGTGRDIYFTASQEQQIPEQPSQLEQTQELFTE